VLALTKKNLLQIILQSPLFLHRQQARESIHEHIRAALTELAAGIGLVCGEVIHIGNIDQLDLHTREGRAHHAILILSIERPAPLVNEYHQTIVRKDGIPLLLLRF
jgi:hypothetical protein